MSTPVYFIPATVREGTPALVTRVRQLLQYSPIVSALHAGQDAVIKLHFGETGNTGHVRPECIRPIAEHLTAQGGTAVCSDTNTLYRGRRMTCNDHHALALEHGFTLQRCGTAVVIADESRPGAVRTIDTGIEQCRRAQIAALYLDCHTLVGVAHFKGHIMAGFGGALKNIGMGCATREGKMAQHSAVEPQVNESACIGCGGCVAVCPAAAIDITGNVACIDAQRCIGCADCIAACAYDAIDVDWEAGSASMIDRMIEYAAAVLCNRQRTIFVNFALRITADCDCMAKDEPDIAPDIGVLASTDPVALDQACHDLVVTACDGTDVFAQAHPRFNGLRQLEYAERLGLGLRRYELVRV